MGTEKEVFLKKHALSASLLFETDTLLFQSRLIDDVLEIAKNFCYSLIITYCIMIFRILLNYFRTSAQEKVVLSLKI